MVLLMHFSRVLHPSLQLMPSVLELVSILALASKSLFSPCMGTPVPFFTLFLHTLSLLCQHAELLSICWLPCATATASALCFAVLQDWLGYWLNQCCCCIFGSLLFLYAISNRKPPCRYTCITVCVNHTLIINLLQSNKPRLSVGQ